MCTCSAYFCLSEVYTHVTHTQNLFINSNLCRESIPLLEEEEASLILSELYCAEERDSIYSKLSLPIGLFFDGTPNRGEILASVIRFVKETGGKPTIVQRLLDVKFLHGSPNALELVNLLLQNTLPEGSLSMLHHAQ